MKRVILLGIFFLMALSISLAAAHESSEVLRDRDADMGLESAPKSMIAGDSTINPDDYSIHFKDSYRDAFYLNRQHETDGFILYRGVFESIKGIAPAMVFYEKSTAFLTLTATYREKYIMTYQLRKVDDHKWNGQYSWLNSPYDPDKLLRRMFLELKKGAFGQ